MSSVVDQTLAILQDDWVIYALPFFLIAMAIEWTFAWRKALPLYERQDFLASMGVMGLTVVIDLIPKLLGIMLMFVCWQASPLNEVVSRAPQWWVLLFFLDDLTYYSFHRANHEVRIMWAGHVSHHNSQHYNYGTALRQGVGERVIKYLFWCPLALLGFDPVMIVTMMSLSLIYQFWLHTETLNRMPAWFEWFFNTPSHHRVHHASNVRYLDRNHAGVLIIWDRLFGTFSPELPEEPVRYGLTRNIDSFHPVQVSFGEYADIARDIRAGSNWRDTLSYLLLAPGWSHDGEDKRSNTLRRALRKSNDQQ
jgi:sterol desaturase/sphingolipid hydroxylase (fatty acid hydroxylase superfamily)